KAATTCGGPATPGSRTRLMTPADNAGEKLQKLRAARNGRSPRSTESCTQEGRSIVQSTQKRLGEICKADFTPQRTQLLWLDSPHASEEERANLIRQAIAEGRMKQTDEVVFAHWKKCLSID